MLGISVKDKFEVVEDPSKAAVIVINTCSFINASKEESIDAVLEAAKHKLTGVCEKLIVAGCLPQRYKADLKVSFPEVDAFVGTGQYGDLLKFVSGEAEEDLDFKNPRYIHSEHTPRINTQPKHRAYLKIAEGCMKHCSFCIIPKIRGTLRSRTITSLITEATNLVDGGVKELNLIAQDLTDYGRDLNGKPQLLELLQELSKIEELKWIRLFYVYPDELSDDLLQFIADNPKVTSYLDMPVQHISDRLLRRMNRHVVGEQIRERITRLRTLVPDMALRSTILVGYPSETDEEFQRLYDFVKEVEFDHLGVFAYSREENTASFSQPGHLEESVKEERRNKILELQQEVSEKRLKSFVGKTLKVLVEGPAEGVPFMWAGRHAGQAPDVDGQVLLHIGETNHVFTPGEMIDVKIEKSMEYDLVGSPV